LVPFTRKGFAGWVCCVLDGERLKLLTSLNSLAHIAYLCCLKS